MFTNLWLSSFVNRLLMCFVHFSVMLVVFFYDWVSFKYILDNNNHLFS